MLWGPTSLCVSTLNPSHPRIIVPFDFVGVKSFVGRFAVDIDFLIVYTGYNLLSPKVICSTKVRRGGCHHGQQGLLLLFSLYAYLLDFISLFCTWNIGYGYQTRYRLAIVSSPYPFLHPLIKPNQVK